MADARPTPTTGWPSHRLLFALLAVSAVLNLFFIAGAVWTRLHAPPGWGGQEERYQRMARELDLNPQQRVRFNEYVAAMRARNRQMHEEIAPLIAGAWQEIAEPQADLAQIMQRYDDASRKWRAFQREATVQTLGFLSTLSPAQRSKFIEIQGSRRARWLQPHAHAH
jgi:Spy/CpxP family protein refolding chaperone